MKSNINFIFNTHLPFVRHPEYPKFLEEDWLFEAVNESYIPLLRMMYRLKDQGIKFKLTFSISPTICEMLSDPVLKEKLEVYLQSRLELGKKEVERLKNDNEFLNLAQMYVQNIAENINFYTDKCQTDLLSAFNELANLGYVELITTCATHAYLPLFRNYPVAVNAQIETGLLEHEKKFDKVPEGFWLPECGYYPGLEDLLKRNGVSWISLASQALFLSEEKVNYGTYQPTKCPNGLWCFPRDLYLSQLIWSDSEGYPADTDYREFYRDIGYDLPLDYIQPYIHEPQVRVFTGFKYWSITGKTADKKVYNIEKANDKTYEHAKNFIYHVKRHSGSVENLLKDEPVFTLSFDTELFGHWWFEGVQWLENVIKLSANDSDVFLTSPSDIILKNHEVQVITPAESSWGQNGSSQVWLDSTTNAWLAPHLLKSLERMSEIAGRFPNQKSLKQRFLTQAAREVLLMMASDWLFIMHNSQGDSYSEKRITNHIKNFNLVYDDMCKNAVNTEWLVKAEKRNNIFADLDYNIFNPNYLKNTSAVFKLSETK